MWHPCSGLAFQAVLPLLAVLPACGNGSGDAGDGADALEVAETGDPIDTDATADTEVVGPVPAIQLVDLGPGVVRDGVTLVRLDPLSFRAARISDGDLSEWNLDPWWLDSDSELMALATMPELTWEAGERLGVTTTDTADWPVVASVGPGDVTLASLTATEVHDDRVTFAVRSNPAPAYLRFTLEYDTREIQGGQILYGGGNLHDGPTLNGRRLPMQLEADPTLETFYNERHVTVPLVVSSAGWALWVETDHAQSWDVGLKAPGRLEITIGGPVDIFQLYLFAAAHPLDLYRSYYAVSTLPRVPPPWGYGPWLWRDETPGQGTPTTTDTFNPGVEHDLAAIRAYDLPTSAYWIDRPYATALNTFDFTADYPDPAAMIRYAHAQGFRMALWHTPYAVPDAARIYGTLTDLSGFPPRSGLALNTFGATPVDFTNAAARAFWTASFGSYVDLGVEGAKLDFAEDIVLGFPGLRTNIWQFSDGSDERTMHHDYPGLYHETYRAALRDTPDPFGHDGFLFARAGKAGGHGAVDALWPGDLDADFARHRDPGEGGRGRVGGLPAALSYALSTAASGYPFFAADTGGYRHGPPSNEAYRRWFELTAVMPVMQVGGSDNQVPWEKDHFRWDDSLLDDYREHARLHIRLYPYVASLAARLGDSGPEGGRPLVRPLGLAHPECGVEPGDQYLLGDALLVAPVVTEGTRSRRVTFPAGTWVEVWSGATFTTEGLVEATRPNGAVPSAAPCETREVSASIGRVPLWQRAGTLVPMLRPSVDTLAPTEDPALDSAATDLAPLWIAFVPGHDASFSLWETSRLVTTRTPSGGTRVAVQPGPVFYGPQVWVAFAPTPPRAVTDDEGRPLAEVGAEPALLASPNTWRYAEGRLYVHAAVARIE